MKNNYGSLQFLFNSKTSSAKAHRILVEVYDDNLLSKTRCKVWFRQFKNDIYAKIDQKCVQKGVIYYELSNRGETINT